MRLKQFLFALLRFSLVPLLIREAVQRRRATIILYHDPTPEVFARQVRALKRRYNVISLRQLVDAVQKRDGSALPPKPLVITFDDGHVGNHALKPVIESLEVPVTIFLCAAIIGTHRRFWFLHAPSDRDYRRLPDEERLRTLADHGFVQSEEVPRREALSWNEIQNLSKLVDFQAHTLTHAILPYCSDEKARKEICDSRRVLEQAFGTPIYAISYPNGDYSDREVELAREAGYVAGITVDLGFNAVTEDLFRLKRICMDDSGGVTGVVVRASGLWDALKRLRRRPSYGWKESPANRIGVSE
jgi:peptidoglycan/xylan/chitin deacetylase (PgdA/CDA1 family)